MTLSIGVPAPDFDRIASNGASIRLRDFAGKKNLVLYFYPGDFTPVCTKETCGFRDIREELARFDTEVVGVSTDSDASHVAFASAHSVGFALISDPRRELAKAYGAGSWLHDLFGKVSRVTYVIDKESKIAAVFRGELRASIHLDGVKAAVAQLR